MYIINFHFNFATYKAYLFCNNTVHMFLICILKLVLEMTNVKYIIQLSF